jgi:soluble lytic murein transglycosylase-like protein
VRWLSVALLAVALFAPAGAAAASSFQLTDSEGVTHFTNAPTDPRYQRIPGLSGTATGWLAAPQLARGGHRELVREVAQRHGVGADLVEAVIRVESGGNPGAISPKGAQGLMQLMPATASAHGVRNAFDPRQNVEGGVRHLRYLMERYPDNLPVVLAAYNAGEGAVSQHKGIPPYPETQQYVRKVLGYLGRDTAPVVDPSRVVYRLVESDGTITYTNVKPASAARVR